MDTRRRLRLIGGGEQASPLAARIRLDRFTIGIAEVVPDAGAVPWALELALALAAHEPLTWLTVAFDSVPALPAAVLERLREAGVAVHACALSSTVPSLEPLGPLLHAREGRCLCVGEPAVALLEPSLAVLLGTEAPPQRWLSSLRPHAGEALLLPTPRPSLARALAVQLRTIV